MAATTAALSVSFSVVDQFNRHLLLRHQPPFSINPKSTPPRFNLTLVTCSSPSPSSSSSALQDNPPGKFLSYPDLQNLQFLQTFKRFHKLPSGSMLLIRVMQDHEMDITVELLAESFAESMMLPKPYVKLLAFLVKQYLTERRALMPHAATLIAFHRRDADGDEEEEDIIELAGTVEVSFDKLGANGSPPTPTPPKDAPYICNMTVNKTLRRQGIGWHLLKASEELISQMTSVTDVYLHCRIIDSAPFNMYSKAGYSVFKTDTIFTLLTLQRRKHLMRKQLLPPTTILSETNSLDKTLASTDV